MTPSLLYTTIDSNIPGKIRFLWPHRLARSRTRGSQPLNTGSNPVGATSNFSLIPRGERHKALIGLSDQSFIFVFTCQRLRASFPDEAASFRHSSLLVFKISPKQAGGSPNKRDLSLIQLILKRV